MPLSEEEQRLLDEMERNLYGETTDVHSASRGGGRVSSRGIAFGLVGVLAGILGLIAGVASGFFVWGLVGFVLMVAGCVAALSMRERTGGKAQRAPRSSSSSATNDASFMQRLEDRWDSRE